MLACIRNHPQCFSKKYYDITKSTISIKLNENIASNKNTRSIHSTLPISNGVQKTSDKANRNNNRYCSSEYKSSIAPSTVKHFGFGQRKGKLFQSIEGIYLINQNRFYGTQTTSKKTKMVINFSIWNFIHFLRFIIRVYSS